MALGAIRRVAAAATILAALAILIWVGARLPLRQPNQYVNPEPITAHLYTGEWGPSPQLAEVEGLPPMLIVPSADGLVTAFDAASRRRVWQVALPRASQHSVWVMADPVRAVDQLVFAYSWLPWIPQSQGTRSHHAAVIDLRRGIVNTEFPPIEFAAQARGVDDAIISFDPEFHHARSGLAHVPVQGGLGLVYVGFGADRDQGIWHGWLYEIDLEAWRRTRGAKALANVLVTTPVTDCTAEQKNCGGGVWAFAGPQIYRTSAGYEILVQTGNGRLDLSRNSYAQSLIRLTPGLKFAPRCDTGLCAKGDPKDPSRACLDSCRNLFVPRLMAGDPPLDPVDGSCRGVSFLRCLDIHDWDFGGGSPMRFESDGKAFYLTASKVGGIYLIDAERLGVLYDRKQAATLCGVANSPCPAIYEGLALAQPQIGRVGQKIIAVVPTFNPDKKSSAGVVGYEVETGKTPKLKEIWRTPATNTPEARQWFREPPTRLVISDVDGAPVAWIADNSEIGRLLAIRLRDGHILANIRTNGRPMRNAKPVVYKDVIYLPTLAPGQAGKSRLEAYPIRPPEPH